MKYCTSCGSQNLNEAHFCEKCGIGFQFPGIGAVLDKNAYVGKTCPFCQYPIKPGEMVTVCPACGVPHHAACWIENGSSCTTFGCTGQKQERSVLYDNCESEIKERGEFCGNCGVPGNNRNQPLPDNTDQSDVREGMHEECASHIPQIEEAPPQAKRKKGLLIAVAVVLILAGCGGVYSFLHQDKVIADKPVNNSKVVTKNNNVVAEEKKVITNTGSIKENDVIGRAKQEYLTYVDSKFGYSIDYPAEFKFKSEEKSFGLKKFSNGEGYLIVLGHNTSPNEKIKDVYENVIRTISADRHIDYTNLGDTWWVVTYETEGLIYYSKTLWGKGSVNSFTISYPTSKKNVYDPIAEHIEQSFHRGNTEVTH